MQLRMATLSQQLFWALTLAAVAFVSTSRASDKEYGVYEFVVRKAQGTFDHATSGLQDAAGKSGWLVVATVDAGKMDGCGYNARVLILCDTSYAKSIIEANPRTGPFAVLDRINLFQDEDGMHVSVVNPHSINRTVLLDDTKYEQMTETHLQALRAMISSAVNGEESRKQYGEIRDKGYIGKTMGVVAGGPFNDKLEDEFVIPGSTPAEVAAKVEKALGKEGKEWGTRCVFNLPLPAFQTHILGVSGTPLDTQSFEIVGSGDDDDRDSFKCPGLAHAAAYPFELVIVKEGNDCKVRMVTPMFRMKMFFEDAGKWAFMKHMGMPGSIAGEVTDRIKAELNAQ